MTREIAEVSDLLRDNRLLTLTGPGGTGKTRLSLEVAGRALRHYADGVFFVELSAITDPELVLPTIAQTLDLPDRGGRDPMERLIDHIGDERVLLVLDNFEQVVGAPPRRSSPARRLPEADGAGQQPHRAARLG